MKLSSKSMSTLLVVLLLASSSGCATVKPWQKGLLAKPEMAWSSNPLEAAIAQHQYFAKEASTGGDGSAGGGCGCN